MCLDNISYLTILHFSFSSSKSNNHIFSISNTFNILSIPLWIQHSVCTRYFFRSIFYTWNSIMTETATKVAEPVSQVDEDQNSVGQKPFSTLPRLLQHHPSRETKQETKIAHVPWSCYKFEIAFTVNLEVVWRTKLSFACYTFSRFDSDLVLWLLHFIHCC